MERRRIRSRRQHDNGVVHGAAVFEFLDDARDGRALLADGDVDADHVGVFLIDDRVDREGGLAGLAVADDEFALPATDGDHGVDGLEAGLKGFAYGLAIDDAGRNALDGGSLGRFDGAASVDGVPKRADDASDEGLAHGDRGDAACAFDDVAFGDVFVVAEEHGADVFLFKIEDHAANVVGELEQFAGHGLLKAVDAGDAVAGLDDGPDFADVHGGFVVGDLAFENFRDLGRLDFHVMRSPRLAMLRGYGLGGHEGCRRSRCRPNER